MNKLSQEEINRFHMIRAARPGDRVVLRGRGDVHVTGVVKFALPDSLVVNTNTDGGLAVADIGNLVQVQFATNTAKH